MFSKRLFARLTSSRSTLLLTILFGGAGGLLVVFQARAISQIINRVFLAGEGLPGVQRWMYVLLGVIFLRAIFVWLAERAANQTASRVKTQLRQELFEHIQSLGPGYTRGERTGELVNTLVEGIEALDAYFREYLPQLALAAIIPVTILVFVFPIDWISGIILVMTGPLIPVFMILIGSAAENLTRQKWHQLSRMSAYFLDVLQGLSTLKILGRSRAQIQVIARIGERYRQSTMQVLRVAFLSALALELLSTLSTAVIAVGIGLRLLYGRLDFVDALFVLLLAPDFYLPLRLLGTRFHAGMAGISAAERIFAILDLAPQAEEFGRQDLPAKRAAGPPAITLENITYTYPGQAEPALKNISLHIPAGARAALVGPSGAGKSTLAALLLGFISPQRGRILVDGQPVTTLANPDWYASAAWVPQSPYLFQGSAAENIRLANPQADLAELRRAARLAGADRFIAALPQQYETVIGEMGARLSGGQAQRLALARAFLKQAPFLVLDEATANLDPVLEQKIQQSLDTLQQGCTVVMIAHRLPTVRSADLIVVLSGGEIVQRGSHLELSEQSGPYQQLIEAYGSPDDPPPVLSDHLPEIHLEDKIESKGPPGAAPPPVKLDLPAARQPILLLLRLLKPYPLWMAAAILLGFATIASGIGLLGTSAYLIASAALQPSIAVLQVPIVGVRFFGLSRGIFRYLERLTAHETTFRVLANLRTWFYRALEPLAPARLQAYHSGDLLSRILADINTLENFFIRGAAPPIVALLISVMMGFWFAGYAPALAGVLLLFLALAGIGLPLLVRRLSRAPGAAVITQSAALNHTLIDGIQGLPDLLLNNQLLGYADKLKAQSRSFDMGLSSLARLNAFQNSMMLLLNLLCVWFVLFVGVPMVQAGRFTGIALSVIVLAAMAAFEAVQPLPQAASTLESCLQAAARLEQIIRAKPEVTAPSHSLALPHSAPTVAAHRLSFTYPQAGQPALEDLTFTLPAGQRLAIVGPSGAGKSTLAALLVRFWDCPPGAIHIAGQDIREFDPDELRSMIAVVSQRADIFNTTLRENLLIARPEASQDELELACQQANLQDLIQTLPQGYDTFLGEQGQRLSAGERQRIAIARAFLKAAPILIFDEATANLDALTEQNIWRSLRTLMAGRTTLLFTHRLVNLESMHTILVLRDGRVVERGTHAELAQAGGLYQQMLALQNEILRELPQD
jgi:ATP-binding cassette subfamily C protein CydCD